MSREHPEVAEPTLVDAALTYRMGPNHHLVAISALEEGAATFAGQPEYEATLAAFLAQRGRYEDAWKHYRSTLSNGGIPSPAHRASAYRCAAKSKHRVEGKELVLSKVGTGERLSIRLAPRRRMISTLWLAGLAVGAIFHLWPVLIAASAFSIVPAVPAFYGSAGTWSLPAIPIIVLLSWGLFEVSASFSPGGPLLFAVLVLLGGLRREARFRAVYGRDAGLAARLEAAPAGPWRAGFAPPVFPVEEDDRAARRTRPPRRLRLTALAAGVALAAATVASAAAVRPTGPSIPVDWRTYHAPGSGWTLRYPSSWSVQSLPPGCGAKGILLISAGIKASPEMAADCPGVSPIAASDRSGVFVQVRPVAADHATDAKAPLSIKRFDIHEIEAGIFFQEGSAYVRLAPRTDGSVIMTIGPEAIPDAVDEARLIVASLIPAS